MQEKKILDKISPNETTIEKFLRDKSSNVINRR